MCPHLEHWYLYMGIVEFSPAVSDNLCALDVQNYTHHPGLSSGFWHFAHNRIA
jgi:hypothetical protein